MEPFDQAVRTNPSIAGILIGKATHKVGLYADDVIISLTDPLNSLPEILNFPNPPLQTHAFLKVWKTYELPGPAFIKMFFF